jgi:hypothetical protein
MSGVILLVCLAAFFLVGALAGAFTAGQIWRAQRKSMAADYAELYDLFAFREKHLGPVGIRWHRAYESRIARAKAIARAGQAPRKGEPWWAGARDPEGLRWRAYQKNRRLLAAQESEDPSDG